MTRAEPGAGACGTSRTRRRADGLLSGTLALLLFLGSVAAGSLGAASWRHNVQTQARHEFTRQAEAIVGKVREHFTTYDTVFSTAEEAVRSGGSMQQALGSKDLLRNYPGVLDVARVTRSSSGAIAVTDEYAPVASFGLVDFRLSTMVGPQLAQVLADSAAQRRRMASPRYDIRWFSSAREPSFFLAAPIDDPAAPGRAGEWVVVLVYGNWLLQDAIQEAGSSFRGELVEGGQQIAGDYLPIGTNANSPPASIRAVAERIVTPLHDYGRPWSLVVADADGVTRPHIGSQPSWLFAGVALLGLLSGLLVWVLGRSRGRALAMVQRATAELRESQEQLRYQAFHDSLTGLANRALLTERLQQATTLSPAGRDGSHIVAVLLLDLDGFKAVNDRLGHAAGDDVLAEVGRRLRGCVRPQDTVARIGGDEFALLLTDVTDAAEVRAVGARLVEALQIEVPVPGGAPIVVTPSVGMVTSTPGLDSSALLRQADAAMYEAKGEGKSRTALYGSVSA